MPENISVDPTADADTESVRSFALNEDWLATIVGLIIVVLALAGVITESWLPL